MLENSNKIINYTIIIPHKNIPELLNRCLKSIPCRDDLEIIIVDDNSSPDIVDFNNFPGQSRQNTKIIFNKNPKGAGYARNLALPYVRGKWVIFADADDFFNPIFNDKLDLYKDSAYDFIIFSANSVDSETYENVSRVKFLTTAFDSYEKNKKEGELLLKYYCGVPWAKFIKNDLIVKNNILFDEVPMHNDMHFAYLVSFYSKYFHTDRSAIYCVTNRKYSVSKNISQEALLSRIAVIGAMNKFYSEHKCIDSWHKILPDYELRLWDMKSIENIDSIFLKEAIQMKKWAYAADMVRFYAVYNYGGIYLDTDVEVFKPFDDLLSCKAFIGKENSIHEPGLRGRSFSNFLTSHCFGAEKGHPFIKDCLDYYLNRHFILSTNTRQPEYFRFNMVLAPFVQYEIALQYGYDTNPFHQNIQNLKDGLMVYPTQYFDPPKIKKTSYIKHWCAGSWLSDEHQFHEPSFIQKIIFHSLRLILSKFNILIAMV